MRFNKEILKKVQEKEKALGYIDRCINVSICPKCGAKLVETIEDSNCIHRSCGIQSCTFSYRHWVN